MTRHHFTEKCEKCGAVLEVFSDDQKEVEKTIKKFKKQHERCNDAKGSKAT
jgi:hypothetical protein